jgi:hypothetical protein
MRRQLRMISLSLLVGCSIACCSAKHVRLSESVPLSHFKCYVVNGQMPGEHIVQLTDQFGSSRTAVLQPKYLCAPVQKEILKGERRPVQGNADHLTCYLISGPGGSAHTIENQLDSQTLTPEKAELLCVPTVKGTVSTPGQPPG